MQGLACGDECVAGGGTRGQGQGHGSVVVVVDFPPESIAATAVYGLSEGCSWERSVHEEASSLELVS